jgi:hypothetical protein
MALGLVADRLAGNVVFIGWAIIAFGFAALGGLP